MSLKLVIHLHNNHKIIIIYIHHSYFTLYIDKYMYMLITYYMKNNNTQY